MSGKFQEFKSKLSGHDTTKSDEPSEMQSGTTESQERTTGTRSGQQYSSGGGETRSGQTYGSDQPMSGNVRQTATSDEPWSSQGKSQESGREAGGMGQFQSGQTEGGQFQSGQTEGGQQQTKGMQGEEPLYGSGMQGGRTGESEYQSQSAMGEGETQRQQGSGEEQGRSTGRQHPKESLLDKAKHLMK